MKRVLKLKSVFVCFVAATAIYGCETNQQTGQVLGGAAGAAAGTQVGDGSGQTIATIGGALIGAFIGGEVGRRMDENDHEQTNLALENSPTGQNTRWVNPDSGYQYNIEPTNTFQTASGPCRDYTVLAVIDGRNETINGTACRQTDGTWQ